MNRRVASLKLQSTATGAPDTYFDKVIKYIPGDVVAAWVAVSALVKTANNVPRTTVMWICFVAGLVLAAAWTWKQTHVSGQSPAVKQIVIATIAFGVWVFALGTPFDGLEWYRPLYASLLLILFTLVVGLVDQ